MRNRFDSQLVQLNDDLVIMGTMIEEAIAGAVKSVTTNDIAEAAAIRENDEEIDNKEKAIEALCLKLLLQQQPVARDLRLISSALKMITDMERIGDQASDICEIFMESDSLKGAVLPLYISQMAEEAIFMVNNAIEAFVKKNYELAKQVKQYDTKVDNLFNQIKADLIEAIKNNTKGDEQAIDILMIAKYLEKIGDHAVNIAEWVMFSITGEHSSSKYKAFE